MDSGDSFIDFADSVKSLGLCRVWARFFGFVFAVFRRFLPFAVGFMPCAVSVALSALCGFVRLCLAVCLWSFRLPFCLACLPWFSPCPGCPRSVACRGCLWSFGSFADFPALVLPFLRFMRSACCRSCFRADAVRLFFRCRYNSGGGFM